MNANTETEKKNYFKSFYRMTDTYVSSGKGAVPPASSGNFIACDAISSKLTEVSKIAESLDFILKELQDCLDAEEESSTASTEKRRVTVVNDSKGSADVSKLS